MHHQLHAARFVKKALQHEPLLGRDRAERAVDRGEVVRQLLCAGSGQAGLCFEQLDQSGFRRVVPFFSSVLRIFSSTSNRKSRDRLRQFIGAARALRRAKRAFPAAGRGHPRRAPRPSLTCRIRQEALPS